MATWSTAISIKGTAGAQLRFGKGPPTASNPTEQNDGDAYLNTDTGELYTVRAGGKWPATPTANITGATGPAGLLPADAPPGPNFGSPGSFALWLSSENGIANLYGPKTATGWPQENGTSGSIRPKAYQLTGKKGDAGVDGRNGLSILTGSGAPTDALGVDGQPGYIDTQAAPNRLYAPKASGKWPAAYTAINGMLPTTGAPSANLGLPGAYAIDAANHVLYGPKAADGTWPASPYRGERGADGVAGAPGGPGVQMNQYAVGTGPQATLLGAATTANQVITYPGSDLPVVYIPTSDNLQLVSLQYLNSSGSSNNIIFNLYDQTTGQVVYTSPSYTKGTVGTTTPTSPVPLTQGRQYVWRVNALAAAFGAVLPFYTVPSTSTVATSIMPTAGIFVTTTFSSTQVSALVNGGPGGGATNPANAPIQYLTLPKPSYLSWVTVTVSGSAAVTIRLVLNSTTLYTVPVTVSAANSPYTTPVMDYRDVPVQANGQIRWTVAGSGSGQVAIVPAITM